MTTLLVAAAVLYAVGTAGALIYRLAMYMDATTDVQIHSDGLAGASSDFSVKWHAPRLAKALADRSQAARDLFRVPFWPADVVAAAVEAYRQAKEVHDETD